MSRNSMFDIHWYEPAFASVRFSAHIRFHLWVRRLLGLFFLLVNIQMLRDSPIFTICMVIVIFVFIGVGEKGGRPCRVGKKGIKRFDLGGSLIPITNCRWEDIDRLEISTQQVGKRECSVLSICLTHYKKPVQIGLNDKFNQTQLAHWAQIMNKPFEIVQ